MCPSSLNVSGFEGCGLHVLGRSPACVRKAASREFAKISRGTGLVGKAPERRNYIAKGAARAPTILSGPGASAAVSRDSISPAAFFVAIVPD